MDYPGARQSFGTAVRNKSRCRRFFILEALGSARGIFPTGKKMAAVDDQGLFDGDDELDPRGPPIAAHGSKNAKTKRSPANDRSEYRTNRIERRSGPATIPSSHSNG